jgi:hypothetical protein
MKQIKEFDEWIRRIYPVLGDAIQLTFSQRIDCCYIFYAIALKFGEKHPLLISNVQLDDNFILNTEIIDSVGVYCTGQIYMGNIDSFIKFEISAS